MTIDSKCKICRRVGVKLFLKGERCFSPKCAMVKKNYPPGVKSKKFRREISEYGKVIQEKQKLKKSYGISERQLRGYVKKALSRGRAKDNIKSVSPADFLIQILETRLDNTIFRLGFAPSRSIARQLVSHGHFQVNGKNLNIPSYLVKKNDLITIKPKNHQKGCFRDLEILLKKYELPQWLDLDKKKKTGKVRDLPTIKDVAGQGIDIPLILEFYSR